MRKEGEQKEKWRKKKRKERKREIWGQYENVVKIVSVLVPFRIALSRETTLSK